MVRRRARSAATLAARDMDEPAASRVTTGSVEGWLAVGLGAMPAAKDDPNGLCGITGSHCPAPRDADVSGYRVVVTQTVIGFA